MENFYRGLLEPQTPRVAEVKTSYSFLTERHLQAAWLEQRYFHALKSAQGEEITVISPGIWNLNAGPDFLKAHLIIDGREVKGDIEIHLVSSDWYHHGHHEDPRYDKVILHVVLWKSTLSKPIYTHSQRTVMEAFLESSFTVSYEKLVRLIDLDLYPHQYFSGSGKCAKGIFTHLSKEAAQKFFRSAAAWRLVEKYAYISSWVEDPGLYFGAGAAMALGYKNNTETFLRLFLYLYPLRNSGESVLLATAMGAAGFFQPHWQEKWGSSDKFRFLHSLYLMQAMMGSCEHKFPLSFQQVRPLNHPLRRLVALVKLICDPDMAQFYALMEDQWKRLWPECVKKQKWHQLKNQWLKLVPSFADPYWNQHFAFEVTAKAAYLSLLGEPIKLEVIKNTVLPLLYHDVTQRGNREELSAFFNFYGSLAASPRNKLKYLKHRFFGEASKGNILLKADLEQGAYQLHKDFCLHYEASCEGCPFIDKFVSLQGQNHFVNC